MSLEILYSAPVVRSVDAASSPSLTVSGCPYAEKPAVTLPGATDTSPAPADAPKVPVYRFERCGQYVPPFSTTPSVAASPCPKSATSVPSFTVNAPPHVFFPASVNGAAPPFEPPPDIVTELESTYGASVLKSALIVSYADDDATTASPSSTAYVRFVPVAISAVEPADA